jgi:hypothetical protein
MRIQAIQKVPSFIKIELGIIGFNAEKKTILACPGKTLHVKDRVVRLGQAIGNKHPESRTKSGKKDS